jgi:general secretion pathway protein C
MSHVPSRLVLIGVVAGASGGTALIAVDGKPAKPFRVGRQVEEGLMLQSVAKRQAVLAASVNGPAVLTLELSALSK